METFYLVDFENVHNEGIKNIGSISKDEHIHIFSTDNVMKIEPRLFWDKGNKDINPYLVPIGKQSVDMHLVSFLGYLLGCHGKNCVYVIVSKDMDYDNIVKFWKKEGYKVSRVSAIPGRTNTQDKASTQVKVVSQKTITKTVTNVQTVNGKINAGMNYEFTGEDRTELNQFMQHGLREMGYSGSDTNRICKYVVAHCNDERMLSAVHNDLKSEYSDCSEVYEDVKTILQNFVESKEKGTKREAQVRSFFGQHFKKKIYVEHKEQIIEIILKAQTRQQINSELMKLYRDGNVVKSIYQKVQPLMQDLPGN